MEIMRKVWNKYCVSGGDRYLHIDQTLEMTSDALTNAGKHVMLNIACACCQR